MWCHNYLEEKRELKLAERKQKISFEREFIKFRIPPNINLLR